MAKQNVSRQGSTNYSPCPGIISVLITEPWAVSAVHSTTVLVFHPTFGRGYFPAKGPSTLHPLGYALPLLTDANTAPGTSVNIGWRCGAHLIQKGLSHALFVILQLQKPPQLSLLISWDEIKCRVRKKSNIKGQWPMGIADPRQME